MTRTRKNGEKKEFFGSKQGRLLAQKEQYQETVNCMCFWCCFGTTCRANVNETLTFHYRKIHGGKNRQLFRVSVDFPPPPNPSTPTPHPCALDSGSFCATKRVCACGRCCMKCAFSQRNGWAGNYT